MVNVGGGDGSNHGSTVVTTDRTDRRIDGSDAIIATRTGGIVVGSRVDANPGDGCPAILMR